MKELPRYLRFARALALVGGLGAAACGDDAASTDATTAADTADVTATTPTDTAVTSPTDTAVDAIADATVEDVADAAVDCATCVCADPDASSGCIEQCCIAVGPLAPPDLPVASA